MSIPNGSWATCLQFVVPIAESSLKWVGAGGHSVGPTALWWCINNNKSNRSRGNCKSYNLLSSYKPDNRHCLALDTKESVCNAGDGVQSLGQEDPLEKEWQPTPVFLPGESHRQRSLVGYSLWGHKELGATERLTLSLAWLAVWLTSFCVCM